MNTRKYYASTHCRQSVRSSFVCPFLSPHSHPRTDQLTNQPSQSATNQPTHIGFTFTIYFPSEQPVSQSINQSSSNLSASTHPLRYLEHPSHGSHHRCSQKHQNSQFVRPSIDRSGNNPLRRACSHWTCPTINYAIG